VRFVNFHHKSTKQDKLKKVIYKKVICLIIGITLGCRSEVHYTNLNGGYYLSADDVLEDMSLGYQDGEDGVGVIDATVFAVGQDNNFIIVKQHPRNFPDLPDKDITCYFIIPLRSKPAQSSDKNFYGPFNLDEFEAKKKELNVKDIAFTFVFKDLQ